MRFIFLTALLLPFSSCIFHQSTGSNDAGGPYIDSVGYKAMQARFEAIDRQEDSSLISEALAVQDDTLHDTAQTAIFQSIEESYQRYLTLFTPVKRSVKHEIRCKYNLVETFDLLVLDPQPFINALLHTMSLKDLVTLDFRVEPVNTDTTLLYVVFNTVEPSGQSKAVTVKEDDLILSVTRHHAALMTSLQ